MFIYLGGDTTIILQVSEVWGRVILDRRGNGIEVKWSEDRLTLSYVKKFDGMGVGRSKIVEF